MKRTRSSWLPADWLTSDKMQVFQMLLIYRNFVLNSKVRSIVEKLSVARVRWKNILAKFHIYKKYL
jgi:hypothetical protein